MTQDSNQELRIEARDRPGQCFTPEQVAEIAGRLKISLPASENTASAARASQDANSLVQIDADGAVQVDGVTVFDDSVTYIAADGGDIVLSGWPDAIDPSSTYCAWQAYPVYGGGESGIKAKDESGDGTVTIRPQFEIVSVTKAKITCRIYNATADAVVNYRLVQFPIPPTKS